MKFTLRQLYLRYSQNRNEGGTDTRNTVDIVVIKVKTPA